MTGLPREFFYENLRPAAGLSSKQAHDLYMLHAKLRDWDSPVRQRAVLTIMDSILEDHMEFFLDPLADFYESGYDRDSFVDDIGFGVFSGEQLYELVAAYFVHAYGPYTGPLNLQRDGLSVYASAHDSARDSGELHPPYSDFGFHSTRDYNA